MKANDNGETVRLSQIIAALESGVSVNSEDRPAKMGERGVLKVSSVTAGAFMPEENKVVVAVEEMERLQVTPKAGDILMTRANGSKDLVGSTVYVKDDVPHLFLSDKLWRVVLRDVTSDSSEWLFQVLNSTPVRNEIIDTASGSSGMRNISKEAFLAIRINRPPFSVQRAIAAVLSAWDRGIRQTTDLIAAKRRFKQGLMQQLLTGKRRFPGFTGEWKRLRIGDIASEVFERNTGGSPIPVLSCTKHDGLVDSLKYFGKRVFSKNTEAYKVVRSGDFAYATNHIEEGSIGLLAGLDAGLVSPMYTVFRLKGAVLGQYLYRLLKTESYRQTFESFTSASVDRRGSLRWKQFSTILLSLPPVEEQYRINTTFELLDSEISLLRQQLAALKTQKKGLMRKLLTGEIRVPVHEGGV